MTSTSPDDGAQPSLTTRVVGGVRWGMVEMVAQQVIRLVITIVLTRLVAPTDFGLLAMALVFTQLAVMVGDLGLGSALQQKSIVEGRHIKSATTVALATGVVFAAVLMLCAPVIVAFYDEPRLGPVLMALSAIFVLRGICTIPRDLLRRNLEFKPLALCTTTAVLASGVVAIYAALNGAGITALVIQVLVENTLAAFLFCLVAMRKGVWRPILGKDMAAVRELAGFGASVSGTRLAYYGANNIDNLLIGRVLGAAPLGLYNLAYRLMLFPVLKVADVIAVVSMPALASIKDEPGRVSDAYTRTVIFVAAVCFPVSVGTAVLAPALIPAIFGDRWLAAVPVVQILAINGVRLALGRMSGVIYEAMGRPHLDFALMSATFLAYSGAVWAGLDHGIVGVAWALTVVGHLLIPIDLRFLSRTIPIRFGALGRGLAPVVAASAVLGAVGWACLELMSGASPAAISLLGALVCSIAYLVTLRLLAPSLLPALKATALKR